MDIIKISSGICDNCSEYNILSKFQDAKQNNIIYSICYNCEQTIITPEMNFYRTKYILEIYNKNIEVISILSNNFIN